MSKLFSRMRGKDGRGRSKKNGDDSANQLSNKPRWEDAYMRTTVEPEEIQDLIRRCTIELKSRALDHPFLLLPFRPTSDPSAVRTFIRHFFDLNHPLQGEALAQDLRMTEPMVISGVVKWCWSRLQGGIVGWDAYELFKVGEVDSNYARDSFSTFIPLSVENQTKSQIIFDYFDLLSAIAAHGKTNGFGGRKLSRMASWWAFEHKDTGSGFEGGYRSWLDAADATSHLFFAYLRSLSPQSSLGGISLLPMSLQKLLQETEYPPQRPALLQTSTNRVIMIVDTVSPTPFALLRRASHFQYRENDVALHAFSEFEDPVKALTEECRRVLKAISLANQSHVSSAKHSTSLREADWSRFEDIGFAGANEDEDEDEFASRQPQHGPYGMRTTPASGGKELERPITPSWADFLSSGFVDDGTNNTKNLLLPPDKVLPPIDAGIRLRSSQSHRRRPDSHMQLEPGELASITRFDLDDAFWWVWISSLAPEETADRKSAFGRCAVIETIIRSGRWLVMEEMVKGAAPEPDAGAYIAEKKGFFSWAKRTKGARRRSTDKSGADKADNMLAGGTSKTSIAPDQQARIHAAAQQLQARQQYQQHVMANSSGVERRGRTDSQLMKERTNSVFTLQPVIVNEASPAMKWANKYDKETIRDAYLANTAAGRGLAAATMQTNGHVEASSSAQNAMPLPNNALEKSPSTSGHVTPLFGGESPRDSEDQHQAKASEALQETHPAQRGQPVANQLTRERTAAGPRHEAVLRDGLLTPEPATSPDGKKHKKLHKDDKKSATGGFRKLFSRKNRTSKLPENAAADINQMLAQAPPPPAPEKPQQVHEEPEIESQLEPTLEEPSRDLSAHSRGPTPVADRAYEASVDDTVSRVDSADAAEARQEFSRFDEGPLPDQPAFAPRDAESDDDATPPPIPRYPSNNGLRESEEEPESAPSPSVPQNRWAKLRNDAASRALQGDEPGYSKADGEDDTSGEETIESRVARIKARVAELTGNMEGVNSPSTVPARQ